MLRRLRERQEAHQAEQQAKKNARQDDAFRKNALPLLRDQPPKVVLPIRATSAMKVPEAILRAQRVMNEQGYVLADTRSETNDGTKLGGMGLWAWATFDRVDPAEGS